MDANTIGSSAAINVQSSVGVSTTANVSYPASPVPLTPQKPVTQSAPTTEQVKKAVDTINASLSANENTQNVQFAIDPGSKRVVVQVIDQETNKVIRQFPSEEIIKMSMSLEKKTGQLISQQA